MKAFDQFLRRFKRVRWLENRVVELEGGYQSDRGAVRGADQDRFAGIDRVGLELTPGRQSPDIAGNG
jgi:hypothetical protein